MNKRFLILCFLILLFTGCGEKNVNVIQDDDTPKPLNVVKDVGESISNCFLDGSKFSIVFKDGQIVRYYDPYDGELSQESIDVINNEHLVGVTDDDSAISIMNSVIKELGGYCDKEA